MRTQNSFSQDATIAGVTFRELQHAADFRKIADLCNRAALVDGKPYGVTVAQLRAVHTMLTHSDLQTKLVLAELDGEVIGYGRIWWEQTGTGQRIYGQQGVVAPEWRHKGLGRALLRWLQGQEKEPCYLPTFLIGKTPPTKSDEIFRQSV